MLFVDDLDRCPPPKIVAVLQALVLLIEDASFHCFLAIDSRIIVNAIETDNTHFYRDSCISGFEWLDKIIQLPFAFPPLTRDEKKKLFRGYLVGDALSRLRLQRQEAADLFKAGRLNESMVLFIRTVHEFDSLLGEGNKETHRTRIEMGSVWYRNGTALAYNLYTMDKTEPPLNEIPNYSWTPKLRNAPIRNT